MMVQRCIRDDLMEDFETGEYFPAPQDPEEMYGKFCKSHNNILAYQWGCWITAYAMRDIYRLADCIKGDWLYTDTDSCYADSWDEDKLDAYNENVRSLIRKAGYGPVEHNGRDYWIGVAEFDGRYSEAVFLGSKRYACRDAETGKLKITVAGVPKSGAACLNDDIRNFRRGLIFPGSVTGKLTHTYMYVDCIYTDEQGNETGDSIDLTPCDYLLDETSTVDWNKIYLEEIAVQTYEEDTKDEAFI